MRKSVALLIILVFCSGRAFSQSVSEIGISAGALQFDLSGTGVAPLWTVHLDRAVVGNWFVGANVTFAFPNNNSVIERLYC